MKTRLGGPLPNFMLIGASRCGTTNMARLLGAHPDVFMSDPKELFFFSHHRNYGKGLDYYSGIFRRGLSCERRGEATTDYGDILQFPWVIERIWRDIGDCDFIYMVRDPFERIESEWSLARADGRTELDLSEAVTKMPELIGACHYLNTVRCYRKQFGHDRLHVVFLEDFKVDPKREAKACFKFLGVNPESPCRSVSDKPYSKESMRRRSPFGQRMRKSAFAPIYHFLSNPSIRKIVRSFTSHERDWEFVWTTEAREYVLDCLGDELSQFLRVSGRPPDFWRIV